MRQPIDPKPASINFVWQHHRNYAYIQQQIFDLIEGCLPKGSVVHTVGDSVEGALSLSLFIRQSRDEITATPADIIMAHGIADKRYFFIVGSDGLPLINKFKYVFVPGNWHVSRIIEGRYRRNPKYQVTLQDDQIRKVGWLRLDPMIANSMQSPNRTHRKLRVLWAPTHNTISSSKTNTNLSPSSFPAFKRHLPWLFLKYKILVSLHPRNRGTKNPTTEKLTECDVVISDFGTMVFESWALGKPVIFPRWCIDVRTLMERNPLSAEAFIYRNRIGLHPESPREMNLMLREIKNKRLDNDKLDLRGNGVADFIDHYIDSTHRGFDAQRTAQELISILSETS
jgi:hypothetical protein